MDDKTKDLDEYGVWVKAGDDDVVDNLADDLQDDTTMDITAEDTIDFDLDESDDFFSIEVDIDNQAVNDNSDDSLAINDEEDNEIEITDFIPLDIDDNVSFLDPLSDKNDDADDNSEESIEDDQLTPDYTSNETKGDEDIIAFETESFSLDELDTDEINIETSTAHESTEETTEETTEEMLEDMLYNNSEPSEEFFDDLEFDNDEKSIDLDDDILENNNKEAKTVNNNEPEILQKILDEIKTIKDDIDNIKSEISDLKQNSSEAESEEESLFNDNNETIALSDDELIDIINDTDTESPTTPPPLEDFNDIEEEFPSFETDEDDSEMNSDIGDLTNYPSEGLAFDSNNEEDSAIEEIFEFNSEINEDDCFDIELTDEDIQDAETETDSILSEVALDEEDDFIINIDEDDASSESLEESIHFDNDVSEELDIIDLNSADDMTVDDSALTLEQELQIQKENEEDIDLTIESSEDDILDAADEPFNIDTLTDFEDSIDDESDEILFNLDEQDENEEEEMENIEEIDLKSDSDDEFEDMHIDTEDYNLNHSNESNSDKTENSSIIDEMEFEDDLDFTQELSTDLSDEIEEEIEVPTVNDIMERTSAEPFVQDSIHIDDIHKDIFTDDMELSDDDNLLNIDLDDEKAPTKINTADIDDKEDLIKLLRYLDSLLDSLPDDKVKEFANSETFEIYKKIFKELGIK